MALAIAVLVWRERHIAGRWRIPLLVLLRLCAVALVLWMLAGPAIQTTVTNKKPKSVAVLIDTSDSMGVVDPAEASQNSIRWAVAQGTSEESQALTNLDEAAATLVVADKTFKLFVKQFQRGAAPETVCPLAEETLRSVRTAVAKLKQRPTRPLNDPNGPEGQLGEIRSELEQEIEPGLTKIAEDAASTRLFLDENRSGRVNGMREMLSKVSGSLSRASDQFATEFPKQVDPKTLSRVYQRSVFSRTEKVYGLFFRAQDSWLHEIERKAGVNRYRFDSSVSPLGGPNWVEELKPGNRRGTQPSTDLAQALEQVIHDAASRPVEAAVLVSDGRHNTSQDPSTLAAAMSDLPVYVVPIGNLSPLRDVVLHHAEAPRTVFLKDTIVIQALIDAYECENESLQVELVDGSTVIDQTVIPVSSDTFSQKVTFTQKAEELGPKEYLVRVTPLEGEQVPDNNQAELKVEIIEDTIRLLLVDQRSRWEYRYLRNLFKRDRRVEFTPLLFEPKRAQTDRPAEGFRLPQNIEEWSRYRAVILGDVSPSELSFQQQDMLDEYVGKKGGNLFIIAGNQSMPGEYVNQPLARLIPVEMNQRIPNDRAGYGLFLTGTGRLVPAMQLADDQISSDRIWQWMSQELPILSVSEYCVAKPTSHVLIGLAPRSNVGTGEGSERAFCCWYYYGKGRVVYLSAPVTYRLRYRNGDELHHRFWGQILRWAISREMAAGSRTVRLSTDKNRYKQGEEVRVTARLNQLGGQPVNNAACRVVARREDRTIGEIDLAPNKDIEGTYEGTLKGLLNGQIVLTAEGEAVSALLASEKYFEPVKTEIVIDPEDALELRNTQCNLPLLSRIAELTGGALIPPTGLGAAMSAMNLTPQISKKVSQEPLWDRWLYLWIFLGLLTIEWVFRKRSGLV